MRAGYFIPRRIWADSRLFTLGVVEWYALQRLYGVADTHGRLEWNAAALAGAVWLSPAQVDVVLLSLISVGFLHAYEVGGRKFVVIDGFEEDAKSEFLRKRGKADHPDPPDDVWVAARLKEDPPHAPGKRILPLDAPRRLSADLVAPVGPSTPFDASQSRHGQGTVTVGSGSPQVQSTKNDPAGSPQSKADAEHEAMEAEARRLRLASPYVEPLTMAEHRAQYLEGCRLSRERKAREEAGT